MAIWTRKSSSVHWLACPALVSVCGVFPSATVRAVGTQTFRRLKYADEFLQASEQALECPVDIIAGREEARLIYLGVTQWVAGRRQKQLVMDIGGGSTELIIGDGLDPLEMESLQFGCVSVTNQFFADGIITEKALKKAQRAVAAELQELQHRLPQRRLENCHRLFRHHPLCS